MSRPDPERTCAHLRKKADYYVAGAADRPEHQRSPDYPWCEATLKEVGPDGDPVGHGDCRPGRGCFVPVLPPEV
jgi:hypothetical protein